MSRRVGRRRIKLGVLQIAGIIALAVMAAVLGFVLGKKIKHSNAIEDEKLSTTISGFDDEPATAEDWQQMVEDWEKNDDFSGAVMIYDLDNDEILAEVNADRPMNIASIYKLFYVYAGYRQIDAGSMDANQRFVTTNDYRAGSYSFAECLDLMVRESYNGCADAMRNNSAQSGRALAIMDELGLENTSNLGLVSTAADLTEMLKLMYYHADLSDESAEQLMDSMLNQPATLVDGGLTYDWRQGLPTGFSSSVKVYDKVGWEWNGEQWNTYADAAIVEFPELDRHLAVVAITSGISSHTPYPMQDLGRRIEDMMY